MPPSGLPSRRRSGISPGALALEVGSIVLAVLLAFAVNAWWAGRATDARVAAVEEAVRDEVLRNRGVLDRRLPYHEAMLDSLMAQRRRFDPRTRRLRADERLPLLHELGFEYGLMTASDLTDAGWQTALATDVLTEMDIAQVRQLSETYAGQDLVNETADRLIERLGTYNGAALEGEDGGPALFDFAATLTDLVLRQREQTALYDSLLTTLGTPPPEPPAE